MFRRFGAFALVAGMVCGFAGCSLGDITKLDIDGDGMVSRDELLVALANHVCGGAQTPATPTDPPADGDDNRSGDRRQLGNLGVNCRGRALGLQ